ncbi:hypothetical protein QJQ45_014404, partial [Haematococcus lacustris]
MFPTFSGHNDIVVVDALTPIFNGVQAGDVVICVRPVDPSEHIIKRVVAVAGDEVVLYPDKDHAHIRRVKVRSSSGSCPPHLLLPAGNPWWWRLQHLQLASVVIIIISSSSSSSSSIVTISSVSATISTISATMCVPAQVPVGHVWIQGDNLLHSLDSRMYGPVPAALLRGRVLYQA